MRTSSTRVSSWWNTNSAYRQNTFPGLDPGLGKRVGVKWACNCGGIPEFKHASNLCAVFHCQQVDKGVQLLVGKLGQGGVGGMVFDIMLVLERVQFRPTLAKGIQGRRCESFGMIGVNRRAVGIVPDGQSFAMNLLMENHRQNALAGWRVLSNASRTANA